MVGAGTGGSENIIHRMAMDDPIPWFRKPNLRNLYLLLFPCVIGIEMTSGFDSQIINSAQLLPAWKECEPRLPYRPRKQHPDSSLQSLAIPRDHTVGSSPQPSRSAPSSGCP